jgi:hypothetical protein
MKGLSGLITTPMWREFMDVALSKLPEESFTQPYIPTDVKPVLAGAYTNAYTLELTLASSTDPATDFNNAYNGIHNILHYVNKNDPRGPYPENPSADEQYRYWEYGVQLWKQGTLGIYASSTAVTASSTEPVVEEEEEPQPRRRRSRN